MQEEVERRRSGGSVGSKHVRPSCFSFAPLPDLVEEEDVRQALQDSGHTLPRCSLHKVVTAPAKRTVSLQQDAEVLYAPSWLPAGAGSEAMV